MSAIKSEYLTANPLFSNLNPRNRRFIEQQAGPFRLTVQDLNNLVEIATDFEMWDCGLIEEFWDEKNPGQLHGKAWKQSILARIRQKWQLLKDDMPDYGKSCATQKEQPAEIVFKSITDNNPMLGVCPVFSHKTRCCNLQTLDAVMNCGYGCSYCSIQSFYHHDEIVFHENFRDKLSDIKLDPERIYHIGTGQSSDSLLWGNRNNVLRDLFDWVGEHPNVILELKTKSANINYLLNNVVPRNVIVTWSVNAETIVNNEEHRTAPLHSRLAAARRVADKGIVVGFHLHPIVAFKGWQQEYDALAGELVSSFYPQEVALVSLGTLTYIKPVIKTLRQRKLKSKILQMPMEDAAGKLSYPYELKVEFFGRVYQQFKAWHESVFFYLCMEDTSLWPAVFGYDYATNQEFEDAMKNAYLAKINARCCA
jgi:spore photoproduct lyase